jgi:orotidine-5'-phosphate decarboxylase
MVGEEGPMPENVYRRSIEKPSDRIIVALDNMDWDQARQTMSQVGAFVGMGKANSIAQRLGWEHAVQTIADCGAFTMADGKFHDIPETVRLHTKAVTEAGASLITVHASGGVPMLEAAVAGREEGREALVNPFLKTCKGRLGGILGITVLTSLQEECVSIYGKEPEQKVLEFARSAQEAGIDGIVCSGKELRAIRAVSALDSLITVVPGITPEWAKKPGDQKRVVTPAEAIENGADFIVVGRAITQPWGIPHTEAAERIATEVAEAA